MVTTEILKRLTAVNLNERAFLSLYLADAGGLIRLEGQLARDAALLRGYREEAAFLADNLATVRRLFEREPPVGPTAVFVCSALGFLERYELAAPIRDLVWIDRGPYLRPLARLLDEFETYAVVIADNREALIQLVEAGAAQEIESVRGDIKNHVKKGGWSQKRYERRRDKQLLLYAREIVEHLERLDREESFNRLILVGSGETLHAIADELPQALAAKVVGRRELDLAKGDAYVEAEIFELFVAAERADEASRWQRIETAQLQGGQAALGPVEVWAMADQGRVAEALITQDVRLPARRCRTCEYLAFGEPGACPKCGADNPMPVDGLNEIAERLLATGAEVDFARGLDALAEAGHVAARLRW